MKKNILGIMPYYGRVPYYKNEILSGTVESYFLYAFESLQKYCDSIIVGVTKKEDLDWLMSKNLARYQPLFFSNISEEMLPSSIVATIQQNKPPFDYFLYSDPWNILSFDNEKNCLDILNENKDIYIVPNRLEPLPISKKNILISNHDHIVNDSFFKWTNCKVPRKNSVYYVANNEDNKDENYYRHYFYKCNTIDSAFSGSYFCHQELFFKIKTTFNPENCYYHAAGWDIYKQDDSIPIKTKRKWDFCSDSLASWDYNAYYL